MSRSLFLEDIHKTEYKNLVDLYFCVKRLIISAEKVDHDQVIPITAISELRNALDHIMRMHAAEIGLIPDSELQGLSKLDYWKKHLDKAFAHLYRAGYDAYDLISISTIDYINSVLDPISQITLYTVVPNAAICVYQPYFQAKEAFINAKLKKDVETSSVERKYFESYERAAEQLIGIRDILVQYSESLFKYEKEHKRGALFAIILAVISALLGVGLTLVFQCLSS